MQKDIEDAENVLDTIEAGERLKDAMARRHLGDVEASVNNIKKKKLEKTYALELIDADKLMNKLRRLERLRQEILELNQSTISEIRSYQKPPEAVHQVMISVYLLLGYKEKELKVYCVCSEVESTFSVGTFCFVLISPNANMCFSSYS